MALIALGSNLGSQAGLPGPTLVAAIQAIARDLAPVTGKSRLFGTPCFPAGAGPDYVNAAVAVATDLPAAAVLARLHAIEATFGRARRQRWGQRTLDLDLVALGDAVLPDAATQTAWRDLPAEDQRQRAPDRLILPHPRLQDRAFVLVPLAEIAPDWRHPLLGLTVVQMRDACDPADLAAVVPLDAPGH